MYLENARARYRLVEFDRSETADLLREWPIKRDDTAPETLERRRTEDPGNYYVRRIFPVEPTRRNILYKTVARSKRGTTRFFLSNTRVYTPVDCKQTHHDEKKTLLSYAFIYIINVGR